ncbi:hypothetical protein V7138_00685 [Bacillus sp. JJ1533]|uniref:DUF7662 domain-containing protein n=1 Tax=Bacillus sp. JJ1533 TaxID=3122959 RepID=UPI002FFF2E47
MSRVNWSILFDFLNAKKEISQITLTFEELETILGNKLPESAFVYDAYWRNDNTHSQARAWMSAGWKTIKPNPQERKITFIR